MNVKLFFFLILVCGFSMTFGHKVYEKKWQFANSPLNTGKSLLQDKCKSTGQLSEILVKDSSWMAIPAYQNRKAWQDAPEKYKNEIIATGEKALNFTFSSTPASYYLATVRNGNRSLADNFNADKASTLKHLILAELVEGNGRFIDKIIDGTLSICEMTSWSGTSHLAAQKAGMGFPDIEDPIVDLFTAEVGNMLSWTYFFFKNDFDKINPLISRRIEIAVHEKLLDPYMNRDFKWMGFSGERVNNWNIWINYNVLNCLMLIEKNEKKQIEGIYRTIQSVDNYLASNKPDGGCDEGPGYWNHAGGKMFEYLDLLSRVTHDRINIFNEPLIRNIGSYIYKACIYYPYFVNFADAGPTQSPSPFVVYHFGDRINDPMLKQMGLFMINKKGWYNRIWGGVIGVEHLVRNLFDYNGLVDIAKGAVEPVVPEFWLQDTEIAGGRDITSSKGAGFYFAAKGGNNAESHNHNDVGSFILFYNEQPVFVDAGVGTYTVQTFNEERYTIWSMQSGYHNIVTINGKDQKDGEEFVAQNCHFKDTKKLSSFSVDVAKAYEDDAKVDSWVRTYTLNKGKDFSITDEYDLKENKGDNVINLLTCCNVNTDKKGEVIVSDNDIKLRLIYNPQLVDVTFENVKMEDESMEKTWKNGLRRIRFMIKSKELKGKMNIRVCL